MSTRILELGQYVPLLKFCAIWGKMSWGKMSLGHFVLGLFVFWGKMSPSPNCSQCNSKHFGILFIKVDQGIKKTM